LENLNPIKVTVSPNPAKAWTTFTFKLPLGIEKVSGLITDSRGKIIHAFECNGNQHYVWDTRNLKNGLYLYTIRAGNKTKSGKIIVSN